VIGLGVPGSSGLPLGYAPTPIQCLFTQAVTEKCCVNCVKRAAGCISALSMTDGSNVTECYRVHNERHCFYTNGSVLSWDEAREFCSRSNSTLPIITDKNIDNVFQQFLDLVSDTGNLTVWLDAYAQNVSRHGRWHWTSGKTSGKYCYLVNVHWYKLNNTLAAKLPNFPLTTDT